MAVNNKKVNPLSVRLGIKPKNPLNSRINKSNPLLKRITSNDEIKKQTNKRLSKPINPLLAAINGSKRPKLNERIKPKQPSRKVQRHVKPREIVLRNKEITIKNSSLKHFIKISNLETGTSADDLKSVLKDIGQIQDVKVFDLPSGSSVGEVIFKDNKNLKKAYDKLNGVVADGRVIKVTICDGTSEF